MITTLSLQKNILIGEVFQITVSEAFEPPFRKKQKKNQLKYKQQHYLLKLCMLNEFNITTTIKVSNSMFIGAVFQFEVTARDKKKLYKA